MKDLSYALEMAAASGLDMAAAKLTMARLKRLRRLVTAINIIRWC